MNNLAVEQGQFELLKDGDKDAYAYFFVRHNTGIFNYIRIMGASRELARDLSKDVFKRLWDLRDNLESSKHLAAYIYVMARHIFLEHLRKMKIATNNTADPDEEINKELELVCQRVLVETKAAMKTLSPKRRLVLHLLYIRGLDVKTVATQLRLSPQTVRNHKAQAATFLRAKLYDRELLMPLMMTILLRWFEEQ